MVVGEEVGSSNSYHERSVNRYRDRRSLYVASTDRDLRLLSFAQVSISLISNVPRGRRIDKVRRTDVFPSRILNRQGLNVPRRRSYTRTVDMYLTASRFL